MGVRLTHCGLGICLVAAVLSACSQNGPITPSTTLHANDTRNNIRVGLNRKHIRKFLWDGYNTQTFIVPTGVTQLTISVIGGSGGGFNGSGAGYPGKVKATVPVTSGEMLTIVVGGDGVLASGYTGFNGGGYGGSGRGSSGYSGGGASDVREGGTGLANRILVAGGGGGEGGAGALGGYYGQGGAGGGSVGGTGGGPRSGNNGGGGRGGTQRAGGKGGHGGGYPPCANQGNKGALGVGGDGGNAGCQGGIYGGGGGGGGGGSSHVDKKATEVRVMRGGTSGGNGFVTISW